MEVGLQNTEKDMFGWNSLVKLSESGCVCVLSGLEKGVGGEGGSTHLWEHGEKRVKALNSV